uniref:Small ribosomal subunit protein mS39 n=1 Tax=Callithrix jacchus TaxID=9483 RepID=A0A8I4A088_CALJA
MAVAAGVRWLGLRSRLGQPLKGRQAGLCERAHTCRFYSGSVTFSKVEGTEITGIDEVVIPKKKTWDKVAVLQALASTVNRDSTAVSYVFQDDPFLIPTSSLESRSFLLAKKSGENAAKFIINSYPKYFQKDMAEPHIPCLMPEYFEPQIEEISEAALKERIKLRKVKASVDMFDQLLQAGTTVSLETTNSLLDLLCYYGDQEPATDYHFQQTEQSEELELLRQMVAQKVKPNLQTFNTILKCLRRFYVTARVPALQILREMKAIGIEPSLATYHHIIQLFYHPGNTSKGSSFIIYDIMNELMGKKFSPKDLDDDKFFHSAMRVSSSLRDLELAYQIHGLLNTGDNRKFIGPDRWRNFYYSRFFSLICLMEQIDVTLKWYEDLIPSAFFPHSQTLIDLLQALDVANRLEVIPQIWKDSKEYGHTFRNDLREEILILMARDKHPPELQVAFADCAADIKSTYESQPVRQTALDWPAVSLNCIAVLFLRAGRTQEAWKVLGLFRKHNKIPSNELLNEFMDSAKVSNSPSQAIEVVELASAFSLPICEGLTQRVMTDFAINQEQKGALGKLTAFTSNNDTDSSSDSDSDSGTSEGK